MKRVVAFFLIVSTSLFGAAPLNDQILNDQEGESAPAQVGKASGDAASAARKRTWQNIALAVGAVAIAVTAIILVHRHPGNSAKKTPAATPAGSS